MITALAITLLLVTPPAALWWFYRQQQHDCLGEAYRDEDNNHDADPL